MSEFHYETDESGIATITWDVPGRSMNVMSLDGFAELDGHVDSALADDSVRGIVITSGKDSFAGGMDLNVIARMKHEGGDDPARAILDGVMGMHRVLRKIERAGMDPKTNRGGKPVACALPGTAMGIGLELALACHHSVARDDAGAKIGLPEINVGIFPGGGGTTRLVRKLGAMAAAPWLLEGKTAAPRAAKSAGLIDAVAEDPLAAVRDWVLAADPDDLAKPWDRKGYRMPGGAPYSREGFETFTGASAMVTGRTKGAYPAPKALLSAVYEGALVPFDTALKIEARWFTHVLLNPSAEAMIRTLFLNKQALEKGEKRPDLADARVSRLGVLGAGMMGAGIATVAAQAGIEVVLVDQTIEAAERGKAHAREHAEKCIKRGKTTAEARDAMLARITPTADHGDLAGCDLIVEAVFEDMEVKAEATKAAIAAAGEDVIFATNTSTLPIGDLARASPAPGRFIGIHFFSPVEKMQLVEIIKGERTGKAAVAKALDFVRQIRKTPILVNDARFFYANRCIIPYLNEGMRMVGEGVVPALVENAAKMAGMPVGPLQLVDEISIELALGIARATRKAMGEAYPDTDVDPVIEAMAGAGRMGRKAGAGFYAYDDKGKRTGLWPGLAQAFPRAAEQPGVEEVKDRLLYIQALEAVRAFEAGVLEDIREGDVAAILGWGFAPWSGGPFSWLDMIGPAAALARARDLAGRHGARFAPPALLAEIAEAGTSFHARFGPARAA